MARLALLALPLFAACFAGCAYPNQFRNVRVDVPHALLVGDGVTVMRINDQPTSFWRCRERFRVPAGATTLRTVVGHSEIRSYVLPFTAEAGQTYSLRLQSADGSDRVVLRDSGEHIVVQAGRLETK